MAGINNLTAAEIFDAVPWYQLKGIVLILIAQWGIFRNLPILLAVYKSPQLRNRCCSLMAMLALAHLFSSFYFVQVGGRMASLTHFF